MSRLSVSTLALPTADLGPENPLPELRRERELHEIQPSPDLPTDMVENMQYGHVPSILPYTLQDGYSRERRPRLTKTVVLENDILRAQFLVQYGGRLRSLYHKLTGRELLSVNPVFQPANLALRNAWFSGGVEWNIGTIGHSPLTCAPLHAAIVVSEAGYPVLRLYEWERIRQVIYQIDCYLPDGSPLLYVYVRIINPHSHAVPMYWWSNIAVPETADTRVVVPAERAYRFGYTGALDVLPVPAFDSVDRTYAGNSRRAIDYFFHLSETRPFIAALDGQGHGLGQTSTRRLMGRKLFLWGMGPGGRRWQGFLSGKPYLEIQAGLARTQLEHLRMPAETEWSWLEGYGLLSADANVVHGDDWQKTVAHVAAKVEKLAPESEFEAEYRRAQSRRNQKIDSLLHCGSGWGYLERRRREKADEPPLCSNDGLPFEAVSVTEEQLPWLHLLELGKLPDDLTSYPPSFMVQPEWRALLQQAIEQSDANARAWLHLGIMAFYEGNVEEAERAWQQSRAVRETACVLRNLAVCALARADYPAATAYYEQALQQQPQMLPLLIEYGKLLVRTGQAARWLDVVAKLPGDLRDQGRIRLLEAQAALAAGQIKTVEKFFEDQVVVADYREGDETLAELWYGLQEAKLRASENIPENTLLRERVRREFPLPRFADFRMFDET